MLLLKGLQGDIIPRKKHKDFNTEATKGHREHTDREWGPRDASRLPDWSGVRFARTMRKGRTKRSNCQAIFTKSMIRTR